MKKNLGILINLMLVDFYYFPFEFVSIGLANTKLMMAVLGLAVLFITITNSRYHYFPKQVVALFLISCSVSLFSLLSVVYNNTQDTAYVTYAFSAMVWMSAAFLVCYCIKLVHGRIDAKLLTDYVVAVCVIQCIMAVFIDNHPDFGQWICEHTASVHNITKAEKRMYSLGVGLDVAGSRFSVILAALGGVMCAERKNLSKSQMIRYWLCIALITVVGSMISRTTVVGTGLALCLIGICFLKDTQNTRRLIWVAMTIICVAVPICVVLYNTNTRVHGLLRFAFEGFFSIFEKGHWYTQSNDALAKMVKWPEEFKTWIIGDGYFNNALVYDINYLGREYTGGYYMGTDIGYLRFIYYAGLPMTLSMIWVIWYATKTCCRLDSKNIYAYFGVLICGLGIWCKVATDVLFILALYMVAALMKSQDDALKNAKS